MNIDFWSSSTRFGPRQTPERLNCRGSLRLMVAINEPKQPRQPHWGLLRVSVIVSLSPGQRLDPGICHSDAHRFREYQV
jgi:hypothetical protein